VRGKGGMGLMDFLKNSWIDELLQVLFTLPICFFIIARYPYGIVFWLFYGVIGWWSYYMITRLYVEYRTYKEK
jgi:hypothetical protein